MSSCLFAFLTVAAVRQGFHSVDSFVFVGPECRQGRQRQGGNSLVLAESSSSSPPSEEQEARRILEHRLRNFIQASSNAPSQEDDSLLANNPANSADDGVEQVVQRLLGSNADDAQHVLPNDDDNDSEEDDGIFLDADMYERSRELLGPDGSLQLPDNNNSATQGGLWEQASTSPLSTAGTDPRRKAAMSDFLQSFSQSTTSPSPYPSSSRSRSRGQGAADTNSDASVTDLLQAMRQQQGRLEASNNATATPTCDEETLHRQVLAAEEGFQQQSQLFRESLLDASRADEASELRHGQAFRQRQQQAAETLARQLDEFEAELAQRHVQHPCQKCGCELTPEEIQSNAPGRSICRICSSEDIYWAGKLAQTRRIESSNTVLPSQHLWSKRSNVPQPHVSTSKSSSTNKPMAPSDNSSKAEGRAPPTTTFQRPASRVPTFAQSANPERPATASLSQQPRQRPDGRISPLEDILNQTVQSTLSFDSLQINERSLPDDENAAQSFQTVDTQDDQVWIEMEDPDTGETFYWNSKTDEMKF